MSVRAASTSPPVLTDPAKAEQSRQRTEDRLNELFSRAMRQFLARMEKEVRARVRAGDPVLVAAGEPEDPITLGQASRWWDETVDAEVMAEILSAWQQAYGSMVVTSAVRQAVDDYLPRVKDRLVRGEVWIGGQRAPTVAEDSFDKARVLLARSAAEGWTRPQTAERIATAFGWETNGPAVRSQLDDVNAQIDAILDPLGHPGNPSREYARLHDPHIAALQADRAELVKALDAEKSYWQNRAELIARTESTSLHGFASQAALTAEGFTHKKWLATGDKRTRDSHREANGQIVPVDSEFIVGGEAMRWPGDPSASIENLANCRCTMVSAEPESEKSTPQEQNADLEPPAAPATQTHGGSGGGQLPPRRGMLGPDGPDEFGSFNGWSPPVKRSEIEEFTLDDAVILLDGDGSGHGHHRDSSKKGKHEFPPGWSEVDVAAWVRDLVDFPADAWPDESGFILSGESRGLPGALVIREYGRWMIVTAIPGRYTQR